MLGNQVAAVVLLTCTGVPWAAGAGQDDDFADLSRLIQKAVVAKVPKQFEDRSDWGRTVPDPGNLRLSRLRTRVKVGDREELPNGVWKRTRVWLDDPAKDVRVRVTDLRSLDAKNVRISLEAAVSFHAEQERQRWRRGLRLLGFIAGADATVVARLDCDVAVTLTPGKFPPEATVEPKVVGCQLDLKEFRLLPVESLLDRDTAREVNDELRAFLQSRLRAHEPEIRDAANRAIAQALRDGKEKISGLDLLKFASRLKPKR